MPKAVMIYKVALMWVETLALWEARHRPSHEQLTNDCF